MSQRKLKIAKIVVAVLFALVAALCLMTACAPEENGGGNGGGNGGEGTKTEYTLTWNVASHVEVKADGYETLPTKVERGTKIVFSVEGKDGYTVDRVTRNGNRLDPNSSDGKYHVTINNNYTFNVTETRAVSSISATAKSGVVFYAGHVVTADDLDLTVTYATEETEALPFENCKVVYTDGDFIKRGDTSFTVTFGEQQATVTFDAAMVHVSINPVAGEISSSVLTSWEQNAELENFKNEDGIVTFDYDEITAPITLPTGADLTDRTDLGNFEFTFKNWASVVGDSINEITAITTENDVSLEIMAQYDAELVTFTGADLVMEEDVPTLKVSFTLPSAEGAYLFLYEGNNKFAVKGDDVTPGSGGETTVSFDLRKLADATKDGAHFEGAWMDIRIAVDVQGVTFSNTVVVGPELETVKVGKMIHDDENCYRFIHYVHEGDDGESQIELKIYFNRYAYDYEVNLTEVDGKATLEIPGHINTKLDEEFAYEGATVSIAFGTANAVGTLAADGSFKATLDLTTLPDGFLERAGNITVSDAEGNRLQGLYVVSSDGNKTKLDLVGCGTIFEDFDPHARDNRNYTTSLVSGGVRYTVGTDWNEPFLKVVDEGHEIAITTVTLEEKNGKAYLVLSGTYGYSYTADTAKTALESYYVDIQNNDGVQGGGWEVYWKSTDEGADKIIETTAGERGGTFKFYASLADIEAGKVVFSHVGSASNNLVNDTLQTTTITVGGVEYKAEIWRGWGSNLVCVWVTDKSAPAFEITKADLVADSTTVYFVLSGTYRNYEKAALEAVFNYTTAGSDSFLEADNGKFGADFQEREGGWRRYPLAAASVTVNDTDKTWEVRYDVTSFTANPNAYTGHFGTIGYSDNNKEYAPADLKLTTAQAEDGKSVTLNGLKYSIFNKNGSSEQSNNWGCVSLLVETVS